MENIKLGDSQREFFSNLEMKSEDLSILFEEIETAHNEQAEQDSSVLQLPAGRYEEILELVTGHATDLLKIIGRLGKQDILKGRSLMLDSIETVKHLAHYAGHGLKSMVLIGVAKPGGDYITSQIIHMPTLDALEVLTVLQAEFATPERAMGLTQNDADNTVTRVQFNQRCHAMNPEDQHADYGVYKYAGTYLFEYGAWQQVTGETKKKDTA